MAELGKILYLINASANDEYIIMSEKHDYGLYFRDSSVTLTICDYDRDKNISSIVVERKSWELCNPNIMKELVREINNYYKTISSVGSNDK